MENELFLNKNGIHFAQRSRCDCAKCKIVSLEKRAFLVRNIKNEISTKIRHPLNLEKSKHIDTVNFCEIKFSKIYLS